MVLVAFSRIYLGVHAPQDVIVGAASGLLVMWLVSKLMQWLEAHPDKDMLVACVGIGLAIAIAAYAALKPYPTDYDSEGKLLVDGAKMANDTFRGAGWCVAFLVGWILERRYVGFSTEVPMMTRMTKLSIGTFSSCFLQMHYISFLVPWCVKHFESAWDAKEGDVVTQT